MPPFLPGLELAAGLYADVVEPLVRPWRHAAALLGPGSEVLGYDDARSTDHDWGPRLQLFVTGDDAGDVRRRIDEGLPHSYAGWPLRYSGESTPVGHHIDVLTLGEWLIGQLGIDSRAGMDTLDWLSIPQQQLLGVVRGRVFADPDGELARARRDLAWYPRDVWLWLLASQWTRLGQEEHFVGRAAEVGDELGSRLLAMRISRELICLSFLLAREYRPYNKWLGTAFAPLPGAGQVAPVLMRALSATDAGIREEALGAAATLLARQHNALGLTEPLDPAVRPFHSRPFRVLLADRFASACRVAIDDPRLRDLPLVGSVDQFVDSVDVLSSAPRARHLRALFTALGAGTSRY